jgi:hypothetical protein
VTATVTGYPAGVGWDACTGLGSIDGSALLSVLQGILQRSITFIMDRTTFGQDEVTATDGVFNQAFFIVIDGLKPSDFPNGGITATSDSPTPPTQQQLNQWAPSINNEDGVPYPSDFITFTPTAVSSEGPSLSTTEVQRFTFTYRVTFQLPYLAFTPTSGFPEVLTLCASLPTPGGTLTASALIELIKAGDPFFSSESNGGLSWLSEDIRVFHAIEGSTLFGAPPLGKTPDAALSFIQWIISNLSGPLGTSPKSSDTFENTLATDEMASALSLLPTTPDGKQIFNFAIARVRLNGKSEPAKKVRAFFRLFQSQATTTPYQTPDPNAPSGSPSPSTGPYRQLSDGKKNSTKIPLLGISTDGTEYITVPCFASKRVADMKQQPEDTPNAKPITPRADGSMVYAYFGCWLDNNQLDGLFPLQPPTAPGTKVDGPFSGQTLNTISQVINRGGHQCLVVEIVDDDAPIIDSATPATSDKIAQRNLAFTLVANPGIADSRLATHTFEIRPTLPIPGSDSPQRADELMIHWGNVPEGSVASIYLPAVAASDVLALAARMYATHNLTASDPHTLQCRAGGTTYIPIPKGSGSNYAGLFSVELPLGIKKGQEFKIIVRQVTSVTGRKGAPDSPRRRYVYGAFQITIPVSTKSEMLVPEERMLSIMRWIQETIPPASRWHPVFMRYVDQIAGRVAGLGGDPTTVPPTPTGIWPGLGGTGPGKAPHGQGPHDHTSCTGKINGIVYDHFGDFGSFILETREGRHLRFNSNEAPVHKLVQHAWAKRILTTVTWRHERPDIPFEIILHGAPPPFEE